MCSGDSEDIQKYLEVNPELNIVQREVCIEVKK